MKTAVIYARYSCDNQTEQSIEGQLRVCQQYAQNNDILIVDKYIDRAMTGTNDNRPDFQRMLKDSNKKQWDYVIVYKLDRFSRDKYEATIHKHTLRENGVKLLSAMENIPDTPEGIILESLLEGMNQYYSAELSQKVLRGLKECYIKGHFTGGPPVFGYDIVDKKPVVNEFETEIVREIFSKYAKGYTGKSIAESLINRGIRTKGGQYLDEKKLYKIIANTKYIGQVKHGEEIYTNIFPAIIDDVTWQQVQYIRNSNKHKPGTKKHKFKFLLSGKLICGDCKTFLIGESGKSKSGEVYKYYKCPARSRKNNNCKLISIPKEWLENLVVKITWEFLQNEECANKNIDAIYTKHQLENKENVLISSLEKRQDEAKKASKNLIFAIEQGIITEQTKVRLKELEAEITQYEFDIEEAKQRNYSYLTKEKIKEYLNSVVFGDINSEYTREQIIRTFIREIILYNDCIVITYNFTDKHLTKKSIPDDFDEINEEIHRLQNADDIISKCLCKQAKCSPNF